MKEILTIAANHYAVRNEETKEMVHHVEVVLVLSEPSYSLDPSGSLLRKRAVSQARFAASPKVLRLLAESLEKLANESEENAKVSNAHGNEAQ